MQKPTPVLLAATVSLLVLIWGTTWGAIRISLEGIPPFKGVALRFALGSAILFAVALWRRIPLGRERREWWLWPLQGVLTYAMSYLIVYWAEQWVPSGLTSILWATFPLFVVILGFALLPEERLRWGGVGGVLLGFGGLGIIFSGDFAALGGEQVLFASVVLLASPLCAAVGQVAVKRWGQGLHPISLTAIPMAITALVAWALALGLESDQPMELSWRPVAAVLYLGVAGSALTFSLYFWLLQHCSATRLAMIAYLTPLVAVALGTLVLGEPITLPMLVGAVLVLAGSALVLHSPKEGGKDSP